MVRSQCWSLCDFQLPLMVLIEQVVGFSWQILFCSVLDQVWMGTPLGAGEAARGYGLNQLTPPVLKLLCGGGRHYWRAFGA
jgi:hypothetical protein